MFYRSILILLCMSTINYVQCEPRAAIAELKTNTISGTVNFIETENGILVNGTIVGLPAGLYGFHIHEIGDVSTCDASGPHFNPDGNDHGGRDHAVRHVGDLGNVQFVNGTDGTAIANINFVDSLISFNGTNNIIGRTLVLHEQEDDLGLGGHETSLTTGNAGARIACAIIRDADAENSVGSISPSFMLFTLSAAFIYISM